MKCWSFIYLSFLRKKKNLQFNWGVILSKSTIIEGTNTFSVNSEIYSSHIGYGSYISENSIFLEITHHLLL